MRALFERALTLVESGEIDAAIEAFELAYKAKPHPAVLFNLGQAYTGAGRPLDALRTLRAYLAAGGASEARRQEVDQLIAYNQARVGRMLARVVPDDAEVDVDGRALGLARELKPVELSAGTHIVTARARGFVPESREVVIKPWKEAESTLAIELERASVQAAAQANLTVRATPQTAHVRVDGVRYDGKPLAAGPHWLSVEHPGYELFQRRVDLVAGSTRSVDATLVPAPADELATIATRKRTWAYVTGGLAIGAAIAGVTMRVMANERFRKWEKDPHRTADGATRVQRIDDAAAGTIAASGALALTALTLWLLQPKRKSTARAALDLSPRGCLLTTRW